MPEKELSVSVTPTKLVYQLLESGVRDGAAETLGLEASYWNAVLVALAVLPALSVQEPLTVAALESGPEYVSDVQLAIPEKELPVTAEAIGALYQLFQSGARAGLALAVGLEISIFNMYWRVI